MRPVDFNLFGELIVSLDGFTVCYSIVPTLFLGFYHRLHSHASPIFSSLLSNHTYTYFKLAHICYFLGADPFFLCTRNINLTTLSALYNAGK